MDYVKENNDKSIICERINNILKDDDFCLSINYLETIHRKLFNGILPLVGQFRNTNIKKREVILNGDTVKYSDCQNIYHDLFDTFILEYRLEYDKMSIEEVVKRISEFTAKLWCVHPFVDGNTRTTAVVIQKYLHSIGYDVDNEIFKDNCVYFRNALVKANYENPEFFIMADTSALEKFFRKVLIDETIELDLDDVYLDGVVKIHDGKKKSLARK